MSALVSKRHAKRTPEERSILARELANKRWAKNKQKEGGDKS